MGIILSFVLVIASIGFLSYLCTEDSRQDIKISNMLAGIVLGSMALFVITCIAWGTSYSSYLDLKRKHAVIEQYKETVELYADKGVAEFHADYGKFGSQELTDLKYNNYQTQIGEMIRDMRDVIVSYNEILTSKRVMKNSFFFNWLIILPEDMKTIKMADYIE